MTALLLNLLRNQFASSAKKKTAFIDFKDMLKIKKLVESLFDLIPQLGGKTYSTIAAQITTQHGITNKQVKPTFYSHLKIIEPCLFNRI